MLMAVVPLKDKNYPTCIWKNSKPDDNNMIMALMREGLWQIDTGEEALATIILAVDPSLYIVPDWQARKSYCDLEEASQSCM